MDTPRPARDSPQVVHWNQAGVAATLGSTAAATGAVRPRCAWPATRACPLPGLPWRAACLPCRWPLVPVVALASGRPPRVPLSRDWVPPLGRAVVPGLRVAIYRPLCTAWTAGEEQTSDGWLFVILQMAPVM